MDRPLVNSAVAKSAEEDLRRAVRIKAIRIENQVVGKGIAGILIKVGADESGACGIVLFKLFTGHLGGHLKETGGPLDPFIKWGDDPHLEHMRHVPGDDVRAPANHDDIPHGG